MNHILVVMERTGFVLLWFLLIFPTKVFGSDLKCCYENFANGSIAHHLSRAPGANCKSKWSEGNISMVDEDGNIFKDRVISSEPKKLILKKFHNKRATNYGSKLVTYYEECPINGQMNHAACKDRCSDLGGITTTPVLHNTTEKADIDQKNTPSTGWIAILVLSIIFIIGITIIIICCQKKKCQTPNVFRGIWRAVPSKETPPAVPISSP